MREWNEYVNSQKYSECQLVTALNAKYCLTGEKIEQDSTQYEKLVDLCKARHGSAICIEEVYEKLKLKISLKFDSYSDFREDFILRLLHHGEKSPMLPVEVNVWEKHYGFHSVCIVEYEPRTDCFRVPNFRYQTSLDGWIFEEDFKQFVENVRNPFLKSVKLFKVKK